MGICESLMSKCEKRMWKFNVKMWTLSENIKNMWTQKCENMIIIFKNNEKMWYFI